MGLAFGRTGGKVTLLWSSERNGRFIQGFRPSDSTPACILSSLRDYVRTDVLCRGYTPACILTSRWDLRLSCFTRHFGRRLGITNLFVLLSACAKIGRWGGDAPTEFYKEWAFIAGVPLRSTPACILSSLRDYVWAIVLCRGYATLLLDGLEGNAPMEFYKEWTFYTGVPLRSTPACIITSLRDLRLSCFTRHFGRRLGITNKFVLLSACSIVQQVGHFGLRLGRVRVNSTLFSARSKIRDYRSMQGLRFAIPLPVLCRPYGTFD